METAKQELAKMKRGSVRVMWDMVVIRKGDGYIVGESPSIHDKTISIDEAAAMLARK